MLVMADMHIVERGENDGVPRIGYRDSELRELGGWTLALDTFSLSALANPFQELIGGTGCLFVLAKRPK